MGGVQFHAVTAGFLYSLCSFNKLHDQPLHTPVGQTTVDAFTHFAFFAPARRHGAWHNILILQLFAGRDYTAVQQLGISGPEKAVAGYANRQCAHHQPQILPPRMVQLHHQFGAVTMYPLRHGAQGVNLVIMTHTQLTEGGRTGHIVDTGNLRKDQSYAALGPLFVIVHHGIRGPTVKLTEAKAHRLHNNAVLYRHIADFGGRKQ